MSPMCLKYIAIYDINNLDCFLLQNFPIYEDKIKLIDFARKENMKHIIFFENGRFWVTTFHLI